MNFTISFTTATNTIVTNCKPHLPPSASSYGGWLRRWETKDGSHLESDYDDESNQIVYTVFLPLIEGSFRACLQGNNRDKLELCIESRNSDTKVLSFSHALFINTSNGPFATVHDAFQVVKNRGFLWVVHVRRFLPGGDAGGRGGRDPIPGGRWCVAEVPFVSEIRAYS
ncbi:hypothetical protein AAHE18_18G162300 [Arachis hypogaea]